MNDTEQFMQAQERWLECKNKADWDIMFLKVNKCCEVQLARMKNRNIVLDDDEFHEKAMYATCNVMNRFLKPKGYKVNYLVTVCKNAVFDILTKENLVFNEFIYQMDVESAHTR